jgi:hypothetical protein
MTFVTRYTPAPGEQALLKHIDGAGKVDGSCVIALPIDKWSAPYDVNSFEGHGGGLTFWDGKELVPAPVPVTHNDKDNDDNNTVEVEDAKTNKTLTTTTTATARKNNKAPQKLRPREIHYETRSGDIAFIDRAVWHQADPITKVRSYVYFKKSIIQYKFHFLFNSAGPGRACLYICIRILFNVACLLILLLFRFCEGNTMGLGHILQSYVRR